MLAEILGGGSTSRFYDKLVRGDGAATYAGASYRLERPRQLPLHHLRAAEARRRPARARNAHGGGHRRPRAERHLRGGAGARQAPAIAQAIYSLDNQAALANIVGQALAVGQSLEEVQNWPARSAGGDRSPRCRRSPENICGRKHRRPATSSRSKAAGADAQGFPLRAVPIVFGAFMTIAFPAAPARAAAIQEIISPSGIKAWLVEDYTVPVMALNIAFRGGAAQDPAGKEGLANLMSGLARRRRRRSRLARIPGKARRSQRRASFRRRSGCVLRKPAHAVQQRRRGIRSVRMAIAEPRFDVEPLARIRGQVTANLRQGESDPNEIASASGRDAVRRPSLRAPDRRNRGERRHRVRRRPAAFPCAHHGA